MQMLFSFIMLLATISPVSPPPNNNCRLHRVAPGEVRWATGFWADRFQLAQRTMIPHFREYDQKEHQESIFGATARARVSGTSVLKRPGDA